MKPKSVENYTGMESEEPFGDEMPNFDICGTVFKELLLGCQYGKPSRGLRLVCLFSFFTGLPVWQTQSESVFHFIVF